MVLAYFFGNYESAEQYATTCHEIHDNSFGSGVDAGSVLFYECMVLFTVARNGKRRHIAAVLCAAVSSALLTGRSTLCSSFSASSI
jgi:hypothetical protein